ncbi:MAG: hypothetical protein Q4D56_02125 [Bacteroides sp.]|nr:hypothetical protein [Bacteroides sp.]
MHTRKYISLLPLALMAVIGLNLLFAGCGGKSGKTGTDGCLIQGHTDFKEFTKVYLMDLTRARLDSASIDSDGKFSLERTDSTDKPCVMLVRLTGTPSPYDDLDMPVAIERGTVTLELGEYIHTSGTPLNSRIQEFLNDLQSCKDGLTGKEGVTVEEIQTTFSEFYRQQILTNKDNAVGRYIFREYGVNLTPDDRELVKAQLGAVE